MKTCPETNLAAVERIDRRMQTEPLAEERGRGVSAWTVGFLALVATVVSLALYFDAWRLPFYSDDLLQVPWARATSFWDLWGSVSPYGDYRPLHFAAWGAVNALAGGLTPGVLHSLNLAAHVVAGVLVGCLAASMTQRGQVVAAAAGALFFVAFPFAFDVVLWPCALSYPLVVALAVAALLCYCRGRRTGSRMFHIGAIILIVACGFTHESGVVSGGAILLAEALLLGSPRRWRWAVANLVASAVPLALILNVADKSNLLHWPGLDGFGIAMQALVFPIAPLATLLGEWRVPGVLLIGVLALAIIGGLSWRWGRGRWFVFGLLWACLWLVIPLFTQSFDWLRDPPRVVYPAAVGTALIWASALSGPRGWLVGRRALASLLVVLVLIIPGAWFLRNQTALYVETGDLLWSVIGKAGESERSLFVNVPGRVTSASRLYPLGHEGFIPLPPPTDTSLLVRMHTGDDGAIGRQAGGLLPKTNYAIELADRPLAAEDLRMPVSVYVTDYAAWPLELRYVGAVSDDREEPALFRIGSALEIVNVSCARTPEGIVLDIVWRRIGEASDADAMFAHLRRQNGTEDGLAQADGAALGGLAPFSWWPNGTATVDSRLFRGEAPDVVEAYLGVWNPAAGARLPAYAADGTRLEQDAVVCKLAP